MQGGNTKVDGVIIPALDSLSLSIFDIHLEYVKDFGKNLLANLDALVSTYTYI